MLQLGDYLCPDSVVILDAQTRDEALAELAAVVTAGGGISDPAVFLEYVVRRENQSSTGIGHGVAIPHARDMVFDELQLAVGLSRVDLDFKAIDDAPVRLLFMVGLATEQNQYLHMMARISRLIGNDEVRQQMFAANDATSLYELLSQY
jgi:PTS system nitrogen regulatory IIA component